MLRFEHMSIQFSCGLPEVKRKLEEEPKFCLKEKLEFGVLPEELFKV